MNGSADKKCDILSSSDVPVTFIVTMFDSQKRSCHLEQVSACHPNLTRHSVTLLTLICTRMHSTVSSPTGSSTVCTSTCALLLFCWFCLSSIRYTHWHQLQFQHVTGLLFFYEELIANNSFHDQLTIILENTHCTIAMYCFANSSKPKHIFSLQ